jgi:hypothetical protein
LKGALHSLLAVLGELPGLVLYSGLGTCAVVVCVCAAGVGERVVEELMADSTNRGGCQPRAVSAPGRGGGKATAPAHGPPLARRGAESFASVRGFWPTRASREVPDNTDVCNGSFFLQLGGSFAISFSNISLIYITYI